MSSVDTTFQGSESRSGFYAWTDTLKGIYYGPGLTRTALPKLLETLGIKKALIVTGESLYKKVSRTLWIYTVVNVSARPML